MVQRERDPKDSAAQPEADDIGHDPRMPFAYPEVLRQPVNTQKEIGPFQYADGTTVVCVVTQRQPVQIQENHNRVVEGK